MPWFNFIYSSKWYSLCKTRKHFFPVQCLLPLNKKAQSSVSFGAWPNYIPRFFFLSFLFFTSLPAFNPSSNTLRPPEGHCSEKRLQMLNCIDLITKKHIPYSLQKKVYFVLRHISSLLPDLRSSLTVTPKTIQASFLEPYLPLDCPTCVLNCKIRLPSISSPITELSKLSTTWP